MLTGAGVSPAGTAPRSWIGGGSGAGKSTVARRLAERHDLVLYDTDAAMGDHARQSTPEECPRLAEFMAMDMDERWLLRSPETMLETFHWFRGEGFPLILEDLDALPRARGVIIEGFRLLPGLVAPLLDDPGRAVWLLPTPEFRRAALESRGSLWAIAGKTSDPERALENLLERDRRFTDRLRREVDEFGLTALEVDGTLPEDDLVDLVASRLGLSAREVSS